MADSIRITDEAAIKTVEKYAAEKEIPATEAGARLINTAKLRLNASRKWAVANAGKRPAKAKKAKAPAKPKKPSVAKAKPAKAKKAKLESVQVEIPGTESAPA